MFSFTSTFSLCMIAVDRHQLIVTTSPTLTPRPVLQVTYDQTTCLGIICEEYKWQVFFCIVAVWVAGAGAAAPILFNMKLKVERDQ